MLVRPLPSSTLRIRMLMVKDNKKKDPVTKVTGSFVEIKRFELLTPCLQSRCSTN